MCLRHTSRRAMSPTRALHRTESSQRGISSSQEHTIIPPSTTETATPANMVLHLAIPEQRSTRWNKSCAECITPSSPLDGRGLCVKSIRRRIQRLSPGLNSSSNTLEIIGSSSKCRPERPLLLTLDTRSRMFDHTQKYGQNPANPSIPVNWDMAHGKPLLVKSAMVFMKP